MTDMLQQETFYTESHEWITVHGDVATMGITNFASESLGDVVFVEVPDVGKVVAKGDEIAVVESVKAASDVYAPVSGEVVEANEALADAPETVNEAPTAAGWFCKLKLADGAELKNLMNEDQYKAMIVEQAGG